MSDRKRDNGTDPIGTMLGASFGPFGAAVGTVIDEDRFAFKFAVGTNANDDDGMDDATTIEIDDEPEDEQCEEHDHGHEGGHDGAHDDETDH